MEFDRFFVTPLIVFLIIFYLGIYTYIYFIIVVQNFHLLGANYSRILYSYGIACEFFGVEKAVNNVHANNVTKYVLDISKYNLSS